jgi:histidinol-phosphate aminotransferase
MNPLVRWVTKIIRFFRPEPATVSAPETEPAWSVEPVPPESVAEIPAKVVLSKVSNPELVEGSVQPAFPKGRTDPSTSLRSAQDDRPHKKKALVKSAPQSAAQTEAASPPAEAKPVVVAELKPEPKPLFTGRVEITPDLDNPARLRQIKGVISVNDIANRELLDLVPYEPGKPVDDVAREIGLDPASIIKLASNENPLGPSPLAMAAMHQAIETSHFYPDGGGFHLRNAIAHTFGLGRENVVLGNGSNEIIELLFHTFTRPGIHEIITARHAFAVYTLMAQLFGVHAIVVDDVDFTPDLPAMLKAVTPQTRLIFLASPNNPTGTRVTNEALDAFLRDLPPHVIAVLDEAYYEFLDNPPDTVGYVKKGAQVVLMRTFSKIQGLAGLRVGYGLAPAEIANLLQRARQPFNANSIAQAGAMAGLADLDHQKKTKAITDEGRILLENAFAKMGLKYVPSSANFVMVHVGDGGEVFKRLMKKGIIVRSMVSYHLPAYIRVSVGTPEQNARFLEELPGALEGLPVGTRVPSRPTNETDGKGLPSLPQ